MLGSYSSMYFSHYLVLPLQQSFFTIEEIEFPKGVTFPSSQSKMQ